MYLITVAILFRQFNIIEDYQMETEVDVTGVSIFDVIDFMEKLYDLDIRRQIFSNGLLRSDILLLVNGRAVSDRSIKSIVLRDNDVLDCLPYAVGG